MVDVCAEFFTAETQRAWRKPSTATAARFDETEPAATWARSTATSEAGGAGKADPSGKRRLRDDRFLLVAGFKQRRVGA
jgi:hypothetical protein